MKTELKHTPGPWTAKRTAGHETHGQCAIYDESGRIIALVFDGERNAELIASAPDLLIERDTLKVLNAELLEALRDVMWHLDARLIANPDSNAQDAYDEAKAALAKVNQ